MGQNVAAQRVLALIQEHDLARAFPELVHVMIDAQRGTISKQYAEYCLAHIERLLEERGRVPLHLFEAPSDEELNADGPPDVVLGHVRDAPDVPFGLCLRDQARTVIVAGNAGSGKTTSIRSAIVGVSELAKRLGRPIPMLVFDSKAAEYGGMRRLLGRPWRHFSAHAGSWIGLNAPEGVPNRVWFHHVCAYFAAASGVNFGASVLAEAMTSEFQATGRYPTLRTLAKAINQNHNRFSTKAAYAQSVGHQLSAAVLASGELFDTEQGLVADQLISAGESAVFDIGNIQPTFMRMFIIWLLVGQVLVSRRHRAHRVDATECVIILDEADQIVSESMERRFQDGISPLGMLPQDGRELGVSAIIGLHALGNASSALLTNAHCHCIFNLSDSQSIGEAARTLLLPRGCEAIFPALRPGECVCRLAQTAWSTPFLGVARFIPPDRSTERPEYELGTPVAESTAAKAPAEQSAAKSRSSTAAHVGSPGNTSNTMEAAHKLLSAWALHPFTPVVQLWRTIGEVTEATAVAARAELEKLELAEFEDWRIKSKNQGLMVPTPTGWQFLNRPAPNLHGSGGIEHRHGEHWIARVGTKRGFKARMEFEVPGTSSHRADVVWHGEGFSRAFEIVVKCEDNLADHLRACLIQSTAISQVTVVAGTQIELRKQKAIIDEIPDLAPVLDRIDYECIDIYLNELFAA